MMTDNWTNRAGGDFNSVLNWSAGIPDDSTAAQITANGTYTVTSSSHNGVATLEMAKHATLAVNSSNFLILLGSGPGGLAGTIDVNANTYLLLGQMGESTTFANSGAINDSAEMEVVQTVTLTGKGKIVLAGNNSEIVAYPGINSGLTNGTATSGNTISGYGVIGDQTDSFLSFSNDPKGVVNANNGAGLLKIDTDGGAVTNAGLMEASNDGLLSLYGIMTQTGKGQIKAATSGAAVILDNATVDGGLISTVKGSKLEGYGGPSVIDTTTTINNAGTIFADGSGITITGSVKNAGTGRFDADGSFIVVDGTVTKGQAEIDNGGQIAFEGASSANVTIFAGSTLFLGSSGKFTGTVAGMATAGTGIDLSIPFADDPTVNFNATKHLLTVADPVSGVTYNIKIVGTGTFTKSPGLLGSTLITDPPANPASIPAGSDQLLVQSMAAFGAAADGGSTGGAADAPAGGSWNSGGSSDFLATSHHG